MTHNNLLVELFVEELPPKALKRLGEAFGATLLASLRQQGLAGEPSALHCFASPRRLAAHISQVRAVAPEQALTQKLNADAMMAPLITNINVAETMASLR